MQRKALNLFVLMTAVSIHNDDCQHRQNTPSSAALQLLST